MVLSHGDLMGWVAILAGVLILIFPRLLNYVVAGYFILVGSLGLLRSHGGMVPLLEGVVPVVAGVLILVRPRLLNIVVAFALIAIGVLKVVG